MGTRPAENIAPASGSGLLLLDHKKCHPPPDNRTPTMELVAARLLPSIADIGQQVPGIVRDHPTKAELPEQPPPAAAG